MEASEDRGRQGNLEIKGIQLLRNKLWGKYHPFQLTWNIVGKKQITLIVQDQLISRYSEASVLLFC